MSYHILVRAGENDTYTSKFSRDEPQALLNMDGSSTSNTVNANPWEALDRHGLTPTPIAIDFYRAAVAAYSADQRITRAKHSRDGWGRDITLHLPVTQLRQWRKTKTTFEELLKFLTGDNWALHFRETKFLRPPVRKQLFARATPLVTKLVCLLSGGLDSYIGAIDILSRGVPTLFVSHYGGGTGNRVGKVQNQLIDTLANKFSTSKFNALGFHVEPSVNITGERETSSRSRSILFLGLAVLVASALDDRAKVIVPENGFISLNVPLTVSRLGSHTTRTTHPNTINLLREVLQSLGINLQIENPYHLMTKGEMIDDCLSKAFLKDTVALTMSCAHPQSGRFRGGKGSGFQHCGYCLPCLIRRASLHHLGWDPVEDYTYDVRHRKPSTEAEKSHIFAFRMALQRFKLQPMMPYLLSAGPLDCSPEKLEKYINVYSRGMSEVETFLNTTKT